MWGVGPCGETRAYDSAPGGNMSGWGNAANPQPPPIPGYHFAPYWFLLFVIVRSFGARGGFAVLAFYRTYGGPPYIPRYRSITPTIITIYTIFAPPPVLLPPFIDAAGYNTLARLPVLPPIPFYRIYRFFRFLISPAPVLPGYLFFDYFSAKNGRTAKPNVAHLAFCPPIHPFRRIGGATRFASLTAPFSYLYRDISACVHSVARISFYSPKTDK